MDLETLFYEVDDFCLIFEPYFNRQLLSSKKKKRIKNSRLSLSEIMTIIIYFHHSNYRNFKHYYQAHIQIYHLQYFPNLVSYNRFIELKSFALIPLIIYLNTRKGLCTGISFIDTMGIAICHNKRAKRNKVFENFAHWGKSSIDWYYGFKLHLVINEQGEILAFKITPGNVDDRKTVPYLTKYIWGRLFGDKGYISQDLFQELYQRNIKLITPFKKKMKNKLLELWEKLMLRKRSLIETVNDQLQNISQIVHSRHRSPINFLVNVIGGLIAYTWQDKKPKLQLEKEEINSLSALVI
jgi:Transposase DDE domain